MQNRKSTSALIAAAVVVGAVASSQASTFTPGDVVIYRVGDGSAALTNASTAVFLDEYTPTGTLVQSVPFPTAASGANAALTASGSATSEGLLNRSTDGQYLLATGYNIAPGTTSVNGTTSAATPRVVARIDSAATIDTTTALTDFSSANNPRSAISDNGTNLWVTGAAGGVRYATLGATTSTQLSTTVVNLRHADIFDSQLYVSTSSGSAVRIGGVGSGLPTTSGQTITNLPSFPVTGSPYQFVMADLSAAVPGSDTLYVADDGTVANGGGIQKYSLVAGAWTLNGTVTAASVRGLTGSSAAGVETLFATLNGATLSSYVDTAGYNVPPTGTLTTLATATTNTAFRGIDFAPVAATTPEPGAIGLLGVAGLMAVRRRNRRVA